MTSDIAADARNRADLVGFEEATAEGREYKRIGRPTPVDALGHSAAFLSSNSAAPSPAASAPTTRDWESEQKEKQRDKEKKRKKKKQERLRADMIKRVDVPVRVNEMNVTGWLAERPESRTAEATPDPESMESSALATPSEEMGEEELDASTPAAPTVTYAGGPHRTA
jgi:glucan-binding YG repeat protein